MSDKEKDPAAVKRGKNNKKRSKKVELEWGKRLGVRRLDAIAGAGSRQTDLRYTDKDGRVFDIEIKQRIRPTFSLYDEAVLKAAEGTIPVLGLEIRKPHKNTRLIIMSREDFAELVGAQRETEDDSDREEDNSENGQPPEPILYG